jgi:hypothetical protein
MLINDPADWREAQMLLAMYERRRRRALTEGHSPPMSLAEHDLRVAFATRPGPICPSPGHEDEKPCDRMERCEVR